MYKLRSNVSNRSNMTFRLGGRPRLKCGGTRAETIFRLSAKRTSPFKSAGASVQSTTGSRCVCISGSNAGYAMFRGSVKSTGHPRHSPVSPSLPLPCVTVCHHISTGFYTRLTLCTLKSPCIWGAEIVVPSYVGTLLAISAQLSNIIFAVFQRLNVLDSYARDWGVTLQ